jgi:hypothetical protein
VLGESVGVDNEMTSQKRGALQVLPWTCGPRVCGERVRLILLAALVLGL